MAFMRDTAADDDRHAIPLYREAPVVLSPRGSLVAALDSVDLADLADETQQEVDLSDGPLAVGPLRHRPDSSALAADHDHRACLAATSRGTPAPGRRAPRA